MGELFFQVHFSLTKFCAKVFVEPEFSFRFDLLNISYIKICIMNRSIFIALIALFITGVAMGQQKEKTERTEDVSIKKKGGTEEKMTIVIDGDQVTINGRPVTEYDGENIIIRKKALEGALAPLTPLAPLARTMPRMRIMTSPGFGGEDFDFDFDFDDNFMMPSNGKPQAVLGVVTEKDSKGLKLNEITEGSAAAKAGLKKGDVLTKFAGTSVNDPETLRNLVRSRKPDEEVELAYIKAGEKKERKVKAKLGSYTPEVRIFRSVPGEPLPPSAPRAPRAPMPYGETFPGAPMPPYPPSIDQQIERQFFQYGKPQLGVRIQDTDDSSGVKVLDVNEGSLAAIAGIKENDLIVSIDGKRVKDTDEARAALQTARDKTSYPVVLNRAGTVVNTEVKVPKKLKKADL
jgi:serine protease Do